jgi:hypothetical protein
MLFKKNIVFLVVIVIVFISGCGTWRAVPAHGGGKRFDEEQRAVAGCIRTAVAQMDLLELKGKKVSFVVSSLSHDGGGQLTNPGLNYISGSISDFDTVYLDNNRDNNREGWQANISYKTRPDFRPTVFRSSADMNYFNAFLALKMRMSGLDFLAKGGEVTLYVMVDILGTNRSTEDAIIAWTDKLKATCELTYYAVDNKTNMMVFGPRSVSGISEYLNHNSYLFIHNGSEFKMAAVPPTGFPMDGQLVRVNFGDHDRGVIVENFTDSNDKEKKEIEAKLQLADSYIQARNFAAAERLINEILAIDPDNPDISAVRSRLQNQQQDALQEAKEKISENRIEQQK